MNLFLFICLVSMLATSKADEVVELEPVGEPFPCLWRGSLEEIIPEEEVEEPDAPENRIFGGSDATEGQFPYQAGLLIIYEGGSEMSWCGGTILSNEWILTAAHCTSGAQAIQIRLGSFKKNSPHHITFGYENHVHPGWLNESIYLVWHDIALVKMKSVELDVNMAAARLPFPNWEYENARVTTSGWGLINDRREQPNILQYVTMTLMEKAVCVRIYGPWLDTPSIMCVNTNGFGSTCTGDSGGPLVLENTNVVVGISSFGLNAGCTLGFPDGYTSVVYYLDWIEQISGISGESEYMY